MSYLSDDQVNLLKQAAAESHVPVAVSDCEAFLLQPGVQAVVPVKWEGRMPPKHFGCLASAFAPEGVNALPGLC